MADFNKIKQDLSEMLSEKRYNHSIAVAIQAFKLAEIYDEDTSKAFIAGLVHDCCKEISKEEQLKIINKFDIMLTAIEEKEPNIWHGYAASGYIKEKWDITDDDICSAVKYHTCGKKNMTLLEKIIFVADLTSEDRNYPDAESIREISYKNIDRAIYECYKYIIPFIVKRGGYITQNTIDCYNDSVSSIRYEKDE